MEIDQKMKAFVDKRNLFTYQSRIEVLSLPSQNNVV
jgi:hypothetical protein